MIVITTNSSTSVKPTRPRADMAVALGGLTWVANIALRSRKTWAFMAIFARGLKSEPTASRGRLSATTNRADLHRSQPGTKSKNPPLCRNLLGILTRPSERCKHELHRRVGELFIFVDECHRTQGGKLHKTMKALLPGAVFIGFTGTPLLKKDKATSLEVFGKYIHTYKFNEAVQDGVVLDLVYEARDIDQRLSSQQKIDTTAKGRMAGWYSAGLRQGV